jgi:hypothetical protein
VLGGTKLLNLKIGGPILQNDENMGTNSVKNDENRGTKITIKPFIFLPKE